MTEGSGQKDMNKGNKQKQEIEFWEAKGEERSPLYKTANKAKAKEQ